MSAQLMKFANSNEWPENTDPPVHDYLRTGPRTTATDPSTDHPQNRIKNKNKERGSITEDHC